MADDITLLYHEILDKVHTLGENKRHFCVFDELYSGTNPREAVKCGYAYLSHLSSSLNIQYLLMVTTNRQDHLNL